MADKTHVNITLDAELMSKAKEALINISAATEAAIKNRLNYKEIEIKDKCEFCGREQPKAYVDARTDTYHDGLTWLCPDEKWICPSCLKYKSKNVPVH